jgi:hypothetical protein
MAHANATAEQHNQVSGMINLVRNVGGSVGIALTGAMLTNRAQFHQAQLAQIATSYNPQMQAAVQNLTNTLVPAGLSTPDALHQAYGRHLCWPSGTSADPRLYRHILDDGDRNAMPDSAGVLAQAGRAAQSADGPLAIHRGQQ